jgi:cytochrome c oxidase subunit IV
MSHAVISIKTYLVVFLVLMALLSATVAVAYIDLDVWNLPVAMAISIIKGGLIVLFFMHVRYGSNLAKVFAGAGFFWLLILLSLAMSDYATRHWLPVTR